jgi:hypothetical protein
VVTSETSDAITAVDAFPRIRLSSVSLSVTLSMPHHREISVRPLPTSNTLSPSCSSSRSIASLAEFMPELSESDLWRPGRSELFPEELLQVPLPVDKH